MEEKFVECGSWDFPWWSTQWINDDAAHTRKCRPRFSLQLRGDDIDCHTPILRALIYLCSGWETHTSPPDDGGEHIYTAVAKQGLQP